MPAKMARSTPRPPSRLPERPVMRRQLASVLWKGRKMPILTPVRESSGESQLISILRESGTRQYRQGLHASKA